LRDACTRCAHQFPRRPAPRSPAGAPACSRVIHHQLSACRPISDIMRGMWMRSSWWWISPANSNSSSPSRHYSTAPRHGPHPHWGSSQHSKKTGHQLQLQRAVILTVIAKKLPMLLLLVQAAPNYPSSQLGPTMGPDTKSRRSAATSGGATQGAPSIHDRTQNINQMQNGIMQRKQTTKRATDGTAILIRSLLWLSRKNRQPMSQMNAPNILYHLDANVVEWCVVRVYVGNMPGK